MNTQQQPQNFLQRVWYWLVGMAVTVLRWLGFKVTWGQPQPADEIRAYLDAMAEREQRAIEKYGEEYLLAARRGDAHFFELYLSFGMPVNYQHPKTGETALHIAASRRARHIIRAILKTGKCDFLVRDNQGRLASEMAHLYGRDPAVTRLLGLKERKQGEAQGITVTLRPKD
jgi:hypothetical protein